MVGAESKYLAPRVSSSHPPAASRQHILNPFAFLSIGERNQEPLFRSKDIYGRAVDPTYSGLRLESPLRRSNSQ
jgi:hypothetical protein